MFYAYCILSYHFHVSAKSTRNKRKKINIEIDKEEDEDLMGIKADETINKGIFFFLNVLIKKNVFSNRITEGTGGKAGIIILFGLCFIFKDILLSHKNS